MRLSRAFNTIFSAMLLICMSGYVVAEELNLDAAKTIAVVPVKNGTIDQSVYRQFDKLVPELRKMSKKKILKLECRYSGHRDHEQDVESAYKLAARIEKYLRERHKLELDLWVSIDLATKSAKSLPVLTLAVFPEDIKKLDSELINPPKSDR